MRVEEADLLDTCTIMRAVVQNIRYQEGASHLCTGPEVPRSASHQVGGRRILLGRRVNGQTECSDQGVYYLLLTSDGAGLKLV